MKQSSPPPWEDRGSIWKSEAQYWTWIRGQLRRMWTRYPVKNAFIRDNRFRANAGTKGKMETKREVYAGHCSVCRGVFPTSKLQVDHIEPAGSLDNGKKVKEFIEKLMCGYNNMRFVCHPCHKTISLAEKKKISFEQAKDEQVVIDICKNNAKYQKEWIEKYSKLTPGKTAKERRKQITEIINEINIIS